jgi:hypothetical protein
VGDDVDERLSGLVEDGLDAAVDEEGRAADVADVERGPRKPWMRRTGGAGRAAGDSGRDSRLPPRRWAR